MSKLYNPLRKGKQDVGGKEEKTAIHGENRPSRNHPSPYASLQPPVSNHRSPTIPCGSSQTAELSQSANRLTDGFDGELDVGGRIEAAQAKPQTRPRQVFAEPQGPQNMARLGIGRSAGAAGTDGQRLHAHHQGFAVDVGEAQVQIARQAQPQG